MAIINQGILGGLSGKVGTVIGGSWKGINYVRSKPVSFHDKKSNAQISQRNHFGDLAKFSVQLLPGWIKPMWDSFSKKKSGYNNFIASNKSVPTPITLDSISQMKFAVPMMTKSNIAGCMAVNRDSDYFISVTDSDDLADKMQLPTDLLCVAVIAKMTDNTIRVLATSIGQKTRAQMGSSELELTAPKLNALKMVEVRTVVSYISADGKRTQEATIVSETAIDD
jgi:hypothetical protein